jgi:hypothetical protein
MADATRRRSAARIALLIVVAGTMSACATWQPPSDTGDAALRARSFAQSNRGVRVSAAVLGPEDSVRMLGTDVTTTGVQPVWIEVRNETDQVLWLLRSGTDPDYFSPLEVAWSSHITLGGKTNERIDEHFDRMAFPNPIPAHGASSGILFTNPQPVRKLLNVDLLGNRTMVPFTLLLPVPGDAANMQDVVHRYEDAEVTSYDDPEGLRKALENLPCCATTATGRADGAPLNVILIGQLDDVAAAGSRRGFRRSQPETGMTLQVFGRPQDLYFRKRAQAGASAIGLRLWRAPISFRGQLVFLVQAARPVGGRFLPEGTREVRLHPDVDEVRNSLIHDFMYSGGLEKLAFVSGVGAVPAAQPRQIPGAGSYFTDGKRVVLFLGTRPLTFSDVEVLDWEPVPQEPAAGPPHARSNAEQ